MMLLVALLGSLIAPLSFAGDHHPYRDRLPDKLTELRGSLETLYATAGTGAVLRDLRARAEAGQDMEPLRQLVRAKAEGGVERIPVHVHPHALSRVEYANRMLVTSGIDFIRYEAVLDSTVPAPELPAETDAQSYKRWKRTRSVVLPILGFASAVAQGAVNGAIDAGALAQGFALFGLELQFSLFNHHWLKVWRQDTPLLNFRLKEFPEAEANRLKVRLNSLIASTNAALDKVSFVTRAHAWSYLINWGYTVILYGSGVLGHMIAGDAGAHFDVLSLIMDSWVLNTAFYVSFGLSQIALTNFSMRNEISELLRFQIETTALKWNSVWRIVSLVPGLSGLGLAMQLGFTGAIAAPLLMKLAGANAYAQGTAARFRVNNHDIGTPPAPLEPQGLCARFLGGVYAATPFRTGENIWRAVRRWGGDAVAAIRRLLPQGATR
jgi:hypothetical protein